MVGRVSTSVLLAGKTVNRTLHTGVAAGESLGLQFLPDRSDGVTSSTIRRITCWSYGATVETGEADSG
jgi:hypothetical protein